MVEGILWRRLIKKGRWMLVVLFWGGSYNTYAQTTTLDQLLSYGDSTVLVAAHRGDWKHYPENSLSAIQSCIDRGVDVVEVDVRMTKDSVFVLMHDATINRTTNGRGRVQDLTLKTLQSYRLKGPDGKLTSDSVPTLEAVLNLAKGKIILNLDKSVLNMEGLVTIVDSLDAEQTVILKGSLDASFFAGMNAVYDAPLFMPILHYKPYGKMDTFLLRSDARMAEMILGTDTSFLCRKEGRELFKEHQCRIWYNAMYKTLACGYGENKNAVFTWDYLISRGAFIIQTDYPFQLMQYLIDKGLHKRPEGWTDVDLAKLPHEPPDTSKVQNVQGHQGNNPNPSQGGTVYYTIRSGDTLWGISRKYGTTVDAICKLNSGLTPSTTLQIGRKIRVK